MTLTRMSDPAASPREGGHGLAACHVVQIEHAEAIVTGAESVDAPVILQLSENTIDYSRGLTPLATHLDKAMIASVRAALDGDPALVDPRKYLGPAREAVAAEVARLLVVLHSASPG